VNGAGQRDLIPNTPLARQGRRGWQTRAAQARRH
jgi:hypothetical protein